MKKNRVVCGIVIAVMVAATACGGQDAASFPDTQAPVTSRSSTPTALPVPARLPTDAPAPTATPAPEHTPTPVPRPTSLPDLLLQPAGAGLNLPEGFVGQVWLEDIPVPTAFAWDDRGRLYIATQDGDLLRVNDASTGEPPTDVVAIAGGIEAPLGLVFFDAALYVSSRGSITRLTDDDGDGELESLDIIIGDLPVRGNHQNNGPAIGPGGKLYVPVGSTCDACVEQD